MYTYVNIFVDTYIYIISYHIMMNFPLPDLMTGGSAHLKHQNQHEFVHASGTFNSCKS